jgi:hypothetical protein
MSKKLGMFFLGHMLAIFIMYIIPVMLMFPNILHLSNNSTKIVVTEENYKAAVDKIIDADLRNELNVFNAATISTLQDKFNAKNNVILFYAFMLFVSLYIVGAGFMKKESNMKFLGKGIVIGNFVGAAGVVATAVFNASYFII